MTSLTPRSRDAGEAGEVPPPGPDTACQLYGVVSPAGLAADPTGLPDEITTVSYGDVVGLVGPAPTDQRRLRADLLGYTSLLDRLTVAGPVIPVRFGTVLASAEAVTAQVLAPQHDRFVRALAALTGKMQFTVRARYQEDAVVREVLADHPEARHMHQRLAQHQPRRAATPGSAQAGRVRLGELVARGIERKRATDSETLARALRAHSVAAHVQPSRSMESERLADVTCLVEWEQRDGFEAAVAEIADQWRERARLRLLGPMAPYHFAGEVAPTDSPAGGGAGGAAGRSAGAPGGR